MSVLPIVTWPDPVLSTRAETIVVIDAELRRLAADMLETMYAAPGRGLAAPQVGVALRLFVMDTRWKEGVRAPVVVVNPEIAWRSDELRVGPEGCLSIPGVTADVARSAEIRMVWSDLDGNRREEVLSGFEAICAQHEFDHLDGLVTFDRVSPEQRAALESAYAGAAA